MSGFDPKSLLGKAESDRLEFKEEAVLERPASIGREVVGFLNADGGDIWIGVKEEHERAVGYESIPDIEQARRSLLDHLIDTIQPQFRPEEVKLDCEGGLIHVTVKKGSSSLYAQRDGGWRFWIRIDARLREMSFHEIAKEFSRRSKAESTKKDRVTEIAAELRKAQASVVIEKPQLWLRLVPTESLEIGFDVDATKVQFLSWLTDASSTGNRRSGWNFVNDLRGPRFFGNKVTHGNDDDYMRTEITEQGHVTFWVRDSLGQPGSEPSIAPYELIEYPVSVFRLMAAILNRYGNGHADLQVVAGLVISGIRGWSLRPGSPRGPARMLLLGPKKFPDDVLELDPIAFTEGQIRDRDKPDWCGLRIVQRIYERFGFESNAIPPEFDQQQGWLLLG